MATSGFSESYASGYKKALLGGTPSDMSSTPDERSTDRAQTNLVGLFIGLMIAAIVAVQVFIPVVVDAINNLNSSNVSTTTFTVLELLPLFAALLLLIALASPLMRRI